NSRRHRKLCCPNPPPQKPPPLPLPPYLPLPFHSPGDFHCAHCLSCSAAFYRFHRNPLPVRKVPPASVLLPLFRRCPLSLPFSLQFQRKRSAVLPDSP